MEHYFSPNLIQKVGVSGVAYKKITALHFPLFAFQSVAVAVDVSQLSSLCRIVAYSRSQHSVQLTGF